MIREYNDGDVDAVVSVWRKSSDMAHPFLTAVFQDKAELDVRNVYLSLAKTWVKVVDRDIIGFVAMIEAEVGALFVHPDHLGNGYGRELMDSMVDRYGSVTLEVFKQNVIGRRFYDAYGFTLVSEAVHEESGQPILRLAYNRA